MNAREKSGPLSVNVLYICPVHACRIESDEAGSAYICPSGCRYPVIGDIPRFVLDQDYASAFGAQWNVFRTSQLDSSTGQSISRDRLQRLFGGSLEGLRGRRVLEAGCGAGRFTEIMLQQGADVFAVDLSQAVEANYRTCSGYPHYAVCQADIAKLPFSRGQFDVVVCIGVVQHTPSPEETIAALCSQVKPGGMLVIDHYTCGYPSTLSRRLLRAFLLRKPAVFSIRFSIWLADVLWPLHRLIWRMRPLPFFYAVRALFLRISPMVDYHDAYLQLGDALLKTWGTLDMHDTVTDVYKHLRTSNELRAALQGQGMTGIVITQAGNGLEVRATRPVAGK